MGIGSGANRSAYSNTVSTEKSSGGGCFIATAAWGTPDAPEVRALRHFRDEVLIKNVAGRQFIALYNRASPPLARFIAEHPTVKLVVRGTLAPAVYLGLTHPFAGMGLGLMMAGFIIVARRTGTAGTLKKPESAKRRRRNI